MKKRIGDQLIAIVLLLTGLAATGYGGYGIYTDCKFKKNGIVTKGTITDFYFETHYEKRGKTGTMVSYYHPVIDFTANDGKVYHFTDYSLENRSFNYNQMMIGKQLDVVYLYDGKEMECRVHDNKSSSSQPLIFIASGAFIALTGVWLYFHTKKYK